MVSKEFIVTGQLKQCHDSQTLILHRSFMTESKETAIQKFHDFFEPDLKIIKIYSVVDEHGNVV